jgi:hypothetical protein
MLECKRIPSSFSALASASGTTVKVITEEKLLRRRHIFIMSLLSI